MLNRAAIVGSILGTAVGDAIGLPYEALTRRRGVRLLGEPDRHRFLLGRGMVSDDTEHTCMVAQALIASGGNVEEFKKDFGRRLRWWLMSVPGGIGFATLRAGLKLWLGFSPTRSGVFSAGNGPAMRSAIIGAAIDDHATLRELVRASARVTHTDPKAEYGALAVAIAASGAKSSPSFDGKLFLAQLRSLLPEKPAEEFLILIEQAVSSAQCGEPTTVFAASQKLEKGVSGYVYHTVPVAIHAWLRHPNDFRAAIMDVVRCGGDTDTTAAIAGGIIGAGAGRSGIPSDWLQGLADWPRTVRWMERLGGQLADALWTGTSSRAAPLPAPALLARNVFFIVMILRHGFRRALPPY